MQFNHQKIAICNRGEIAVRIIQAVKELGLQSVLLHSSADQNSLAYRLADETLCIGNSPLKDSYLNIEHIIHGVKSSKAFALHPGVGFLSESFELSQVCLSEDIVFIGPTSKQLKLFGNKIEALKYAQFLQLKTLPFSICSFDPQKCLKQAEQIGFPLMIKCAHGGGGVGIQKVNQKEEFLSSLKSVQRVSAAVFGSKDIFLEKFSQDSLHIEVQVFGDYLGNTHHLLDRNCSIQRRNQKIIEETPTNVPKKLKEQMYQAAVHLTQSIKYQGAGTIEFLVQDNNFYFIEMNTRLQVEHPVTEMVLGVDLVQAQILNAIQKTPFSNTLFQARGHSIECRIYAEDPITHLPACGKLGTLHWQHTAHTRLDMGYESNDIIPSFYDSMIGKVIVWGNDRKMAIQKIKYVLENSFVFGVPTNIPELLSILSSKWFTSDQFNTQTLNQQQLSIDHTLSKKDQSSIEMQCQKIKQNTPTHSKTNLFNPWFYPW